LFKYLRGKKVWIEGLGVFTVEDTMNPRFTNKGDLLVRTKTEAKKLGVKKVTLVVLPDKV
jgi:3D (Asp-Asp-Asp) domain-containing protein